MSFKQVIKSILTPNVQLKELSTIDDSRDAENSESPYHESKVNRSTKQAYGADAPYIKIGKLEIERNSIDSFILDETSFIPTISLIFEDTTGAFGGDGFPKTEPIIQVYIKTANEKFKPIRCDFLIIDIKSLNSDTTDISTSRRTTYIVKGELYVPKIYNNISKSYSRLSSKDTLLQIAKDMNLGFAENDCNPSDNMTWINYNLNNLNFINHVIVHAYQDDDSFFTSFIDKYYHLNYINVNQQLLPGDVQKTLSNVPTSSYLDPNQYAEGVINKDDAFIEIPLFLSNDPQNSRSSNFILDYSLISNQGKILKNKGYKKRIYYYNHLANDLEPKNKFVSFYVNPLFTNKKLNKPLIPIDEQMKENTIKKWINIDYGNTHKNWNASRLINHHNLDELEKIKFKTIVNGINFQIPRGAIIPVEIKAPQEDQFLKKFLRPDDNLDVAPDLKQESSAYILDTQLTGAYYVQGIKYIYDKLAITKFSTEYILTRREWPEEYK